jgi:predicted TIM-barrel fold metal-dependent hydrolase
LATTVKTDVIDADAHVIETDRTWEYMREEDAALKPIPVVSKDGSGQEYWVLEGRAIRRGVNISDVFPTEAREASDIQARLKHMDELEVDVHVLYPTVFLRPLAHHADQDYALCRAYNRWLGDIWKQGGGRLRWVVMPPLMQMDKAIEEVHYGKENGACGVFMRGFEGDHRLSDSYLFPLYEEASKLGLPISIHAGAGYFPAFDLTDRDFGFATFKLPGVGAFHDIIMKQTPQKFPDLRWVFVELSAQWVPYVMNDLKIRHRRQDKPWPGNELLEQNNIWVACQTTDDLDYIIDVAGDDHIMLGTDYGHNDTATELHALRNLRDSGGLSKESADKILRTNPRRAYAL